MNETTRFIQTMRERGMPEELLEQDDDGQFVHPAAKWAELAWYVRGEGD